MISDGMVVLCCIVLMSNMVGVKNKWNDGGMTEELWQQVNSGWG